jgi:hypothetical protein
MLAKKLLGRLMFVIVRMSSGVLVHPCGVQMSFGNYNQPSGIATSFRSGERIFPGAINTGTGENAQSS